MTLFGFGKKKESSCPEIKNRILSAKVLGSGCASCHTLYKNTKSAFSAMEIPVEVEYITDMETIMNYGVMSMPVLVINEKVLSSGKVLKAAEIETLLQQSDI